MRFLLASQFLIPRRKVDNSVKLEFVTDKEIPNEMFAELDSLRMSHGWVEFRANENDETQIPDSDSPIEGKTPGERLRARMVVYYNKKHGDLKGFNDWYGNTLDAIGLKYLEQLDA